MKQLPPALNWLFATHFFLVLILKILGYIRGKQDSVNNNVDNNNLNSQWELLEDVCAQRLTTDDWATPAADQNVLQSVLIVETVMWGPDEKYPGLWEKPGEKSTVFVLDGNLEVSVYD